MEYTTLKMEGKTIDEVSPSHLHSLYDICTQIPDQRAARGKHYALADLLIVLILAKLAGMKSLLGEDRCGVRVPPVAQMLAVLNPLVLSLMNLHQVSNVARQIRRFASHPEEAVAWLL